MTQMQYLQIFADKEVLLTPFDDAERGRLFAAMLKYALHCEETELPGNERFIWPVFKQMIDQSRKALDNKSKAGSARQQAATEASSAQHASAESSIRQQPPADHQHPAAQGHINQESRINKQESINKNQDNEGDKRARATRFTPPTASEVADYAREVGLQINAEQFVDFYASKGWRVGNSPMKDWRATVRNWVRRDQTPPNGKPQPRAGKQVGAQQYTQRAYTEGELADDITNELLREAKRPC